MSVSDENKNEHVEIDSSMFVEENYSLKKEVELLKIHVNELAETNSHLITATWRERELKQELQDSQGIIEEQNKKITASINYSERIQKSIVPTNEDLKQNFRDSFVYYRPKDVVSGDFPWYHKKDDYIYIAAVDCTGHGVPGAMLAIIGCLLLNDIVNDKGHPNPGVVLDRLHKSIVKTLKQDVSGEAANDGLDIALCRINSKTNEAMFAGAHRPLYHYTEGKINCVKGDKCPIGGCQYDKNRNNFKNSSFKIKEGDGIFIFSDGLPDQFGGEYDEKYGVDFLNKIVLNMMEENQEMKNVEEAITSDFEKWQGDMDQVDDILLIGLKI